MRILETEWESEKSSTPHGLYLFCICYAGSVSDDDDDDDDSGLVSFLESNPWKLSFSLFCPALCGFFGPCCNEIILSALFSEEQRRRS